MVCMSEETGHVGVQETGLTASCAHTTVTRYTCGRAPLQLNHFEYTICNTRFSYFN